MTGAGGAIAAAQQALARGDPAAALSALAGVSDPSALHLRALALRRAGRDDEARAAFEAALRAAPGDPQLLNNFANLLRQTGDPARALACYDQALAAASGYRDAAFNRALLLAQIGRLEEAVAALERLSAVLPRDARAHSARATMLRELARHDGAAQAYDAALAIEPALATALKGRAQIALERGEADAPARFHRALAVDPTDLGTVHGYAEALEAAGEDATAMLAQVLAARPDWLDGHTLLARMRAEQGEPDFARGLGAEAARQPQNAALALAHAGLLASANRWGEAVTALPPGEAHRLLRAQYLVEAGEPTEALRLLGEEATTAALITRARACFRLADPVAAVAGLEEAVRQSPDAIAAWGLLELGWRALGDARAQWLSGQEGLVRTADVPLTSDELDALATLLRGLHRTHAHPVGQSLRGGTQTRGRLFLRQDPLLRQLRSALEQAVEAYRQALPPIDPGHPLLRHRDRPLALAGSWSVRLTASGFHVHHIHPEGLLSSACYISLPAGMTDEGSRAGWLELGRAPPELGLALEPLATIEPRPGRLVLFPSFLFHGTRPFADGERLTVAFDVVPR